MGDPALHHAARTDVGRVRSHNEDAFLAVPEARLFVVADGLGGHAAGEVASGLAVEILSERLLGGADREAAQRLRHALEAAIREANEAIRRAAENDPRRAGMGTTVTALRLLDGGPWVIGHVGDSRAYLLRGGRLRRLTRDHTYVQRMVERGRLTDEQARVHPRSSVLTRALGIEEDIEVATYEGEARPGDRFLLSTDGLTAMVAEAKLEAAMREEEDPEALARRLVESANAAGGADNITVVVVDIPAAP